MSVWCLTTSPENFAKTAELGWKVQGIKSRRRRTAEQLSPGDRLIYYLTRVGAFAAVVEVTSDYYEDHDPVWTSKPGEDYPWRFDIRPEVIVDDPQAWVPADALREQLEFPRKWPPEHYKLAFQGNIREWPERDYEVVRAALRGAADQGSSASA